MMRFGVVSMGPVSAFQVAVGLKGLDVPLMAIDCSTITPKPVACVTPDAQGAMLRPSHFPPWIATLGADPIGTLCAKLKVDALYLVAFSAGAGGLDGLLQKQAGDKRILGCVAADAYYAGDIKCGYMAQAQASQTSGVPFVLTTSASHDDKFAPLPSRERIKAFAAALGMQPATPFDGVPTPESAQARGPVWWLDYNAQFSHTQHATVVLPAVLRAEIDGRVPNVGGAPQPEPPKPDPPKPKPVAEEDYSSRVLALLGGIGLGYGAFYLARRRVR
jgi:hypothetical protein